MKNFILKQFDEFNPRNKTLLPALIILAISFIIIIIDIISAGLHYNFIIPHWCRVIIVINAIYIWILIFIAYWINYQKRKI